MPTLPDSLQRNIDIAPRDTQKIEALLAAGEYYYSLFTTEGYYKAADYYQQALKVALVNKPEPFYSYCYLSLGQIHDALGTPEDLPKALALYEKYYENIVASKQDTAHLMGALQFLSNVQSRLNLKEPFLSSLAKMFAFAGNSVSMKERISAYAAHVMCKMGDFDKARTYLKNINPDEQNLKKLGAYAFKNYQHAQLYMAANEKSSKKIIAVGERLFGHVTKKTDSLEIADLLGAMLGKLGDFKTAYKYQELEHQLYEEVVRVQSLADVNKSLLESELTLKEENMRLQKTQNRFLTVILLLSGLALVVFAWLYYQNRQKSRILDQQVRYNNTLLQEVHHRVKNNLQLINSFMFLQQSKPDLTADALIREMQSKIGALSLVHQTLHAGQRYDEVELRGYFEQLLAQVIDINNPKNSDVNYKMDIDDIVLHLESVTPLAFLAIELILNTLKHVTPKRSLTFIDISIKSKNNTLYLKYADNGEGLPTNINFDAPKSTGLRLIKRLANQLNAKIKIDNNEQGLVYFLEIPIKNNEMIK